jgi:hypothetical protein
MRAENRGVDKQETVLTMRLSELFSNHSPYWGVPRPRALDNDLIQTCYECGRERDVKAELRAADDRADRVSHNPRLIA